MFCARGWLVLKNTFTWQIFWFDLPLLSNNRMCVHALKHSRQWQLVVQCFWSESGQSFLARFSKVMFFCGLCRLISNFVLFADWEWLCFISSYLIATKHFPRKHRVVSSHILVKYFCEILQFFANSFAVNQYKHYRTVQYNFYYYHNDSKDDYYYCDYYY